MSTTDMAAEKRRQAIVAKIQRSQAVLVADLASQLDVSEVTIRRDLHELERRGALRRIHGGAIVGEHFGSNGALSSGGALRPGEPRRADPLATTKARIGRAAAALIQPGDRIIIDSGSTALEVARHLPDSLREAGNLTVITYSLAVVDELACSTGIHLILIGGVYLPRLAIVVGPQAVEQLKGLHADKIFLGADGITFSHGATAANVLEAEVDRVAIAAAAEVIVVADSSKVGVVGLTTILPLAGIRRLVMDEGAPADFVVALREQGTVVDLV